eukprot:3_1
MTINCHVLAHATYIYLVIISVVSSTIIVGEHGTDHILCGNRTHPCGSLHYASTLINSNFTHDGTITIHGQNTTQIHNYIGNETFTSLYHPCLPQPFDGNHPVIHFNDSSISSMADWYPPICVEYDKNRINFTTNRINFTTRTRSFMFEARDTGLTIHNLLIDMAPYAAFDMPFGIIGVFSDPEGSNMEHDLEDSNLHCVNCAFSNIDHTNPDLVLLYSTRYITLENCTFSNIQSVTDFIFMNAGTISLSHVNFYDFQLNESLIHVDSTSEITYGTGQNTVDIDHCQFVNIASQIALIYDQSISSNVAVYDVAFQNIYGGSIYRAYYQSNAPVHIANVYISTPQIIVSTKETLHSLFDFYFADPLVMDNITVDYQYDVIAHCESNPNGGHGGSIGATASAPQITYLRAECANPITLFQNDGANTIINNMDLSINITEDDISRFKDTVRGDYDYVYMEYIYLRDSHYQKNALILNYGNLTINTITVHGLPPGYFMIMNKDELSVSQLNIIWDRYGDYDPNVLQSTVFIAQTGLWPSTTLVDSHLDGGGMLTQIYMFSGTLTMQNTIFERTGNALIAKSGQAITISNCTFTRIGRYWAHIERVVYRDSYEINPLNIKFIDKTVLIEQSTFHGFQDCMMSVFMYFGMTYELVLRDSLFVVNGTNYYGVNQWYQTSSSNCYRETWALLVIYNNYKVSIYGNTFTSNTISPHVPWFYFQQNGYNYYDAPGLPSIPSCLSANNFSNLAFAFMLNNITSCFRPDLYLCVDRNCSHGHFGNINPDLFDKTSHFNIDPTINGNTFFRVFNDGHFVHAMDNIQINIIGNATTQWTWNPSLHSWTRGPWTIFSDIHMLIADSIFPHNMQIEYDTNCTIEQYDRLESITQYVANFKMSCKSRTDNTTAVDTSAIRYVDHLSPTQIHFTSTTITYFPGQQLTFHYRIFDKLNRNCDDYTFHDPFYGESFIVSLESDALSLSQKIDIDDDGICDVCDAGVMILGVALKHFFANGTLSNKTDIVSIETSIDHSNLLLIEDMIELSITSCPVGYGSDPNDFQCLICPDGTYNLSPNNTDDCDDCHEESNEGVLCHSGSILIRYNWWLGFCGAHDQMATSTCPNSYCCQREGFCNYNETETLCANNRNVSVPLCGACFDDYTEAINKPECMICDEQHWMWLVRPIVLAVLYTVYLVFSNSVVAVNKLQNPPQEVYFSYECCSACRNQCRAWLRNKDFLLLCQTLVLRVLLYYEQALGSVIWPSFSSPYMAEIYTIASIFNLETLLLNSDAEPRCLFEGLTSKDKILLAFFPWLLIFILLLLSFSYEVCRHYFTPNRFRCGNTNFLKAFVALFIISASQILSILFKLLNCQQVGELLVHFYFGVEQCFTSWTMTISLICLGIMVLFFGGMFYIVYRYFTPKDRENPNFALNNFCKYYKPECYYWEWLVLLRRTLISAYAILYTWTWYPSILIGINLGFLGLHHKYQPFRTEPANVAEYWALCGVILVIAIQTTTTSVASSLNDATLVVLSLFIIVPIIAVIWYVICILKSIPTLEHEREDNGAVRRQSVELEEVMDLDEVRTLRTHASVVRAVSDGVGELEVPSIGHARMMSAGGGLQMSIDSFQNSDDSVVEQMKATSPLITNDTTQ